MTLAMPGRHPDQADHADRRARPVRLFQAPPEILPARAEHRACAWSRRMRSTPSSPSSRRSKGEIVFRSDTASRREKKGLPPVFELTWNHTTLRALRVDPTITYLQALYPFPDHLAHVEADDELLRRRGAGASRIRALRRQHRLLRPAAGALHHARSGSTRSSASTRTMAARSSTRTATRWRRAA